MKVVILAGGLGTRLSEETNSKPKPMVTIGGMPIIWHIMKFYSSYGLNDFIICCGYKGYLIKEFFQNYFLHTSDVTIDVSKNSIQVLNKSKENWKITLVDTGEKTSTGGRLMRVKKYLNDQKNFCFTYGDGLSNVNLKSQIKFHLSHKKLATILAVQPPARFGALDIAGEKVIGFSEKQNLNNEIGFINGGFFILSTKCINLIENDETVWEKEPLENLANQHQLMAYKHKDFWQPMDTLREKNILENLWNSNTAPWKIWK